MNLYQHAFLLTTMGAFALASHLLHPRDEIAKPLLGCIAATLALIYMGWAGASFFLWFGTL